MDARLLARSEREPAMIRWGILGPGGIARKFFAAAQQSSTGKVVALGTRNPRLELAATFPGARIHGSYEGLLSDPDVDAIYIATPHSFHAEWAIKASQHGKHVLCEKPLGMSSAEARAMFAAATQAGTFLGEAFMYRLHPLTRFIVELVKSGRLGQVRLIKASFGFAAEGLHSGHRLVDPSLGGGAILDVGCYPVSVARLIAGYQRGAVIEPEEVCGIGQIGPTGVDVLASCLLRFPNGIVADLSCSITAAQDNVLHIVGDEGRLEVDTFWRGTGHEGGTATLRVYDNAGKRQEIPFDEPGDLYGFEFDAANRAVAAGETRFSYPGMTETDSIGNAEVLDRWLKQVHATQ